MLSLKGRVAIVTGSSRGIGAATAIRLAQAGADLVINYNSNKDGAEKVVKQIKKIGQKAIKVKANVAIAAQARELIEKSITEYNKIDILVNNAGITRDKLLLRMKENDWQQVIDVNLKGVFNTTKIISKHMMKQRSGKIINLSSVIGIMGNAGQSNYAASKAGIIGFSKSIARELSSRNINVNIIAPGYIETDMTEDLPEKFRKNMLENIPLNRAGSGEDVANLVLFLASEMSDYITGQVINVDGGMLM